MPFTTAQKLKIKEGDTLLTIHAPADFKNRLDGLPPGVSISDRAKSYQQIHWFLRDKAQLDGEVETVIPLLKAGVTLWIFYPKRTSRIQTDFTRDKGWESLQQHKGLQWLRLVSFDETWSAFALRAKTEKDEKKTTAPRERAVFQYIDTAKRQVYPPDDFLAALARANKEKAFFETLSFTNKKEYVEWIVSAKREETRITRVNESMERLAKGWKNPSNR